MLKVIVIIIILTLLRTATTIANTKTENEKRMKAVKDGVEIFRRNREENNKYKEVEKN